MCVLFILYSLYLEYDGIHFSPILRQALLSVRLYHPVLLPPIYPHPHHPFYCPPLTCRVLIDVITVEYPNWPIPIRSAPPPYYVLVD